MNGIDPELRDKIIETHTILNRMDLEQKEYRINMNGRLKDLRTRIDGHREEQKEITKEHDTRIQKIEHFRTKSLAYVTGAIVILPFIGEALLSGVKKAWNLLGS